MRLLAGSGEHAAITLTRVAGYRRSPEGKTTTPNYSLKHARSGSDRWTASNPPLISSTSPLQTVAMLPPRNFHKVSRAAGPKGQVGRYRPRAFIGASQFAASTTPFVTYSNKLIIKPPPSHRQTRVRN